MRKWILVALIFICCNRVNAQFVVDGAALSLQEKSILTINADFIHSDGAITNDGTINLTGNWYNLSFNQVFNDRRGTVELAGESQHVGGSHPTAFGRLVLAGSGRKILDANQDVFELDLGNCELATNDYILHLQNPAQQSLSRTNGFISSAANGGFRRQMSLNHDYLFPLGLRHSGKDIYRPIVITPSTASDNSFTAALLPQVRALNPISFSRFVEEINTNYYFRLVRDGGSSSVSLSVFYDSRADGDYNTLLNWNKLDDQMIGMAAETISVSPSFDVLDKQINVSQWNRFSDEYYLIGRVATPTLRALEIPNVITANRDGKNDTWKIPGIEDIPDNEVVVFNRWGTKVFQKAGYDNHDGWAADNITAGTYFYNISIKPEGGERQVLKGYLTVVK